MKIYKVNSLATIFFAILIAGLILFAPIILIQAIWNETIGKTYSDITINHWQALILWLIFLVILNIAGIFKFEFAVESGETFDKELIKKQLEDLRKEINKEKPKTEDKTKKENNQEKKKD